MNPDPRFARPDIILLFIIILKILKQNNKKSRLLTAGTKARIKIRIASEGLIARKSSPSVSGCIFKYIQKLIPVKPSKRSVLFAKRTDLFEYKKAGKPAF
jgi:hypothetical protein